MNKLKLINDFIIKNPQDINNWFVTYYSNIKRPIYTSVDLRLSDFKISHVDTNLFPAGFNNLSEDGMEKAMLCLKEYLGTNFPGIQKILIIPENFTRNLKYLESIKTLKKIFVNVGLDVNLGSPFLAIDQFNEATNLEIKTVIREGNNLKLLNGWQPDLIVLNNDLTDGIPPSLQNLAQPIVPETDLGWHARSKNMHFEAFDSILNNFCNTFNFDPWLLSAYYEYCGNIDFKNKRGLGCLAKSVEKIIAKVKTKYLEYGIKEEPYIFIKADRGTYGMGVMTVRSPEEILEINKKHRHSMNIIKSGVQNTKVIIQEGVSTTESVDGYPAENLAYMIGGKVIETFARWNENKDKYSNLNSQGMKFGLKSFKYTELKILIAELAALSVAFEKQYLY